MRAGRDNACAIAVIYGFKVRYESFERAFRTGGFRGSYVAGGNIEGSSLRVHSAARGTQEWQTFHIATLTDVDKRNAYALLRRYDFVTLSRREAACRRALRSP